VSDETTPVAPVSVEADLDVSVDGVEIDLESTGDRLLASVATVRDALAVARHHADDSERAHAVLTAAALTVEVRVRGRIVAVVGADARPNALSRLLSVDPVEVRPAGVVGALGAEAVASVGRLAGLG